MKKRIFTLNLHLPLPLIGKPIYECSLLDFEAIFSLIDPSPVENYFKSIGWPEGFRLFFCNRQVRMHYFARLLQNAIETGYKISEESILYLDSKYKKIVKSWIEKYSSKR